MNNYELEDIKLPGDEWIHEIEEVRDDRYLCLKNKEDTEVIIINKTNSIFELSYVNKEKEKHKVVKSRFKNRKIK